MQSRRLRAIPSSRAWAATCGETASYRSLSLSPSLSLSHSLLLTVLTHLLTYPLTHSLNLLFIVGTTASFHSRCLPTPPSPWPTSRPSRAQRPRRVGRWSMVGGRCMVTSQGCRHLATDVQAPRSQNLDAYGWCTGLLQPLLIHMHILGLGTRHGGN